MSQSDSCVIGPRTVVKGRLSGDEAVTVEGRLEGQVALNNTLTIESGGQVEANVEARVLTVRGQAQGTFSVQENITLESGAQMAGDIRVQRLIIEEGAIFKGNVEMDVDIPHDLLK